MLYPLIISPNTRHRRTRGCLEGVCFRREAGSRGPPLALHRAIPPPTGLVRLAAHSAVHVSTRVQRAVSEVVVSVPATADAE